MRERTVEIGGEILGVGSVVVVFDGNSQKRRKIVSVGTKRIHVEGFGVNPTPFSLEDRKSRDGAYVNWFKTETEVAAELRHALVKSRLRDLGIQAMVGGFGTDSLDAYPDDVLEGVVALLEPHFKSNSAK